MSTPDTPEPYEPIQDVPGLPRVLLIGDSISIAYTLPVRELLRDKANIHRPPANCGPTSYGVEELDAWLGDGPWDVIHFNFGLHDIKHMNEQDERATPEDGRHQVPIDQYETNLSSLTERLEQTPRLTHLVHDHARAQRLRPPHEGRRDPLQ